VQIRTTLDKFYLPAGIGNRKMATKNNLLLLLAILTLSAMPAQAQEAAFDTPAVAPVPASASPGASQNKVPQPATGMAGSGSNFHWSHFSQASSSPFVRVPPGTKLKGQQANVCHYVRPQCVEPGSVPAVAQSQKGAVKRYLAYNVPTAAASSDHKTAPAASAASAAKAKRTEKKKQTVALGYGRKIGEVTYTPVSSNWSGTTISCYGRYH
jgi:hypothetical protein